MPPLLDRRTGFLDRRRAPRATLVASVRDSEQPRLFLSQDVGPRGMTVLRADEGVLPEQTPLHVEFELPGGPLVRAVARVAHDSAGERWRCTGLEFVRMDRAQAVLIDAFVQHRAEGSADEGGRLLRSLRRSA